MKCLINKKGDKVVRVPDKKRNEVEAILDLLEEGWKYCPKHKWRVQGLQKGRAKESVKESAKKEGEEKS